MTSKPQLRQALRQRRLALSPAEWSALSQQICLQVASYPPFQRAVTVLAYHSYSQEPDLSSLFSLPKTWGFPCCTPAGLTWGVWRPGEPLEKSRQGIREPLPRAPRLSLEQADLMVVPGLAYDRQGYRLGYGGGFYDRCLSWGSNPPTLGVVFAFGCFEGLPRDPWDQPVQAVCTEMGTYCSLTAAAAPDPGSAPPPG